MSAPSLHDRLVARHSDLYDIGPDGGPVRRPINPDGPEAAERIRALEEGLREAVVALDVLSSRSAEVCNRLSIGRSTRGELRDRLRDATDKGRAVALANRPAILAEKGDGK